MAKKKDIQPKETGRPSKYSQEIADKICEQISTTSKGLKAICEANGMPCVATVYNWLNDKEHKDFLDRYARAREEQADLLADEIISIADDGSNDNITVSTKNGSYDIENKEWTSRSKLRVEARKWKASKLAPKKYGEKQQVDIKDITEQPLLPD